MLCVFFFKQKTAYEMRISDWSSDVCSSDLFEGFTGGVQGINLLKDSAPFDLPLSTDQWWFYVTLAITLLCMWAAGNLVNSRTGRAIMAIRDNPIAAATMGVNTALYKTVNFGVSALVPPVAGALSAIAVDRK